MKILVEQTLSIDNKKLENITEDTSYGGAGNLRFIKLNLFMKTREPV